MFQLYNINTLCEIQGVWWKLDKKIRRFYYLIAYDSLV